MTRNIIVPYNPKLRQKARELRKNPTFSEKVLWNAIRRKQLGNEFHRQVPIDEYIVDFYCHELLLAIEIDGISHDTDEAKIKDEIRQKRIESFGITVLRFRDEEVKENPDRVLLEIKEWLNVNAEKNIPPSPPSKGDFSEFPPLKGGKGGC